MNKRMTLDYSKIKPLSEASHTIGINGRKTNKNNPSEWAWAIAAAKFPRNAGFTTEQFKTALIEAMTYEIISIMVDDGEAQIYLDIDNNVVVAMI